MLLTVLWLVGSLLNTLLLVQGGVNQGAPMRGTEQWQPEQEEEYRIMGALSGLQRRIVGATAQLDEIDTEVGASTRTKQVPVVRPPPLHTMYNPPPQRCIPLNTNATWAWKQLYLVHFRCMALRDPYVLDMFRGIAK